MFCARCGSKASENQKFCRSCGNRLQVVPPALDQDPKISRQGKNACARAADEIGMMGALTLAAALAFAVIMGLIRNIIPITLPEVFGNILLASIYVALIVMTIGVFLKIVGWVMRPESDTNQDGQRVNAETPRTNHLIESPAPISSITEHATKLLEDCVVESADGAGIGSDRLSQKSRPT
jgi:hypothetical protein